MSDITNDDLKKMKNVDIKTVDVESLRDIRDVKIDPDLPREERIKSFLDQIGNPYLFRCNGHVVRIKFAETDRTLEDCLHDYFNSLQ